MENEITIDLSESLPNFKSRFPTVLPLNISEDLHKTWIFCLIS